MQRKRTKSRIGAAIDPMILLDSFDWTPPAGVDGSLYQIISILPGSLQRLTAVWCAEYAINWLWPNRGRLQLLTQCRKAIEAAREYAQGTLSSEELERERETIEEAKSAPMSVPQWREYNTAQSLCIWSCWGNSYRSAWNTCNFLTDPGTARNMLTDKQIEDAHVALLTQLKEIVQQAYIQALHEAKENHYPVLKGNERDVLRATLIREATRERLERIFRWSEWSDESIVPKLQVVLAQLSEITQASEIMMANEGPDRWPTPASVSYGIYSMRAPDWTLCDEAIWVRNVSYLFSEAFDRMPLPEGVSGTSRPKAKKRSLPRFTQTVGAAFDPAVIFCGSNDDYGTDAWSYRADWIHAVPRRDLHLLLCDMVERWALPLYIQERPRMTIIADLIRDALALGRQRAEAPRDHMAESTELRQLLERHNTAEQEYANQLPERTPIRGMEYRAASMCLYAATYCLYIDPIVWSARDNIKYGLEYSLRDRTAVAQWYAAEESQQRILAETQLDLLKIDKAVPFPRDKQQEVQILEDIDEMARRMIRHVVQRAEQQDQEEGYPPFVLQGNDLRAQQHVILATLYRRQMIDLLQKLKGLNPSHAVQLKLSAAEESLHSIDAPWYYVNNRATPGKYGSEQRPSIWKSDEFVYRMRPWQVLLNHYNTLHPKEVIATLKALPKVVR